MISQDGISLIKYFEGCKLTSYKDSGGILTIGYGHTLDVSPNMVITQDQANEFLLSDLHNAESRVHLCVKEMDLKQCELDSLISQAYNIKSFPVLAKHLNVEGREVYLQKLLLYCHDCEGHLLPGLVKRRQAEKMLFEGQTWQQILPQI